MKTRASILFTTLAILATLRSPAATFNSGSDGSFGPLNIGQSQTTNIVVPPSGVFHCTTINIACYANVTFIPNALNTPVYLLATGNVTIDGRLIVSGSNSYNSLAGVGGPGGFPGGMGGLAGDHTVGGDGAGPGGGRNVTGKHGGVFAYPSGVNSNVYGNALLYPLIGGSGGSGRNGPNGYAGGGGGGAILIASNTRIDISGCGGFSYGVSANGGASYGGGGSGGAIRLVAPYVGGIGTLDVRGGSGNSGSGTEGRVRIDCLDDYAFRTLTTYGALTRGSQMFVFPQTTNRLDIISAAGRDIPLGTASGVTIALDFGAPTNHLVKLRAENFTNDVLVRIAVTPDTGPTLSFDGVIPMGISPMTNTFNVVIPAGAISRIDAWTR